MDLAVSTEHQLVEYRHCCIALYKCVAYALRDKAHLFGKRQALSGTAGYMVETLVYPAVPDNACHFQKRCVFITRRICNAFV